MIACLAWIGKVVSEKGDCYMDDDCNIKPESIKLVRDKFVEILGKGADVQNILEVLEWC